MKVTPTVQATGFGLSGDIGGLPRTTYYTPDGRVISTIPNIREFVRRDKDGKVIATGVRDANLDKGWLLTPPKTKKKYCPGCDAWHDNQKQIDACILKSERFIEMSTKKVQQEQVNKEAELTKRIADLEAKLNKFMEVKI